MRQVDSSPNAGIAEKGRFVQASMNLILGDQILNSRGERFFLKMVVGWDRVVGLEMKVDSLFVNRHECTVFTHGCESKDK